MLDATILQVDSKTYQQRAEKAAAQRDAKTVAGEHGLRTLIARLEAGDASAFMALVERVAQCLAEDGDEDPVGVRRSKAFGIIAHPTRLRDLLARHADQPDDPRHPEQRVAAHQNDPSDPWAADDLPDAGWETAEHGNYHQPGFDDLDDLDDSCSSRTEDTNAGWDEEPPLDEADRAWFDQHRGSSTAAEQTAAGEGAGRAGVPVAFERRAACRCGSVFDLRAMTKAELTACRTRAVVHVHVSDQTLIDQHGVLRTADGPITLDQFRRWLTDADRQHLDPAGARPRPSRRGRQL